MTHGKPDYLKIVTQSALAEDASINGIVYETGFTRMDASGRLVWMDDFRAGLNRHTLFSQDGGDIPVISSENGRMYGYSPSAMLDPKVDNGISALRFSKVIMLSGKVGIEVGLYLPLNHGNFTTSLRAHYVAGNSLTGYISIRGDSNAVYIFTDSGASAVYFGLGADTIRGINFAVKLIIDPTTQMYDSMFVFGTRHDLSAFPLINAASAESGVCSYDISVTGDAGGYVEPVFVNYVAVSADEV